MTKFNYAIANTVSVSGREAHPALEQVIALVAGAPFALSLVQIMAVAKDAGLELPTQTTVRTWLQAAAERGQVSRPTPRVYAAPAEVPAAVVEVAETVEVADAAPVAEVAGEEDPLLAIVG